MTGTEIAEAESSSDLIARAIDLRGLKSRAASLEDR